MRSILRSLAWTLSLCLVALPVHAAGPTTQEVALGHEPVREDLNELRQSVALLAGGGYAVVWDERASPNRAVHLQYVRPDGTVVFPDGGLIVASSGRFSYTAVVAPHPSSGVFVAFVQLELGRDFNEVIVQWIDGEGQRRWPGDGVAATERLGHDFYASDPHLALGPDGGVFLCSMISAGTDDMPINCQHLDANGQRLWSDTGLYVGGVPGLRTVPRVIADGAGGILVFWRNQRLPWSDDRFDPMLLEGQRFAPDGTRLWGPKARVLRTLRVGESNSYGNSALAAVSDGRGGAVLAFEDWSGTGIPSWDVLALRVTGSGRRVWGEGLPLATGPAIHGQGGLVAASDGGAFVAVNEYDDTKGSRLSLFRILPGGRPAWGKKGVALSDPQSRGLNYSAYGSFDDGLLRMAWTRQRQPSTPAIDVHLAVFDPAGRRLSPRAGIPLNRAPDTQILRGFVFDPERAQGFALFWDRRSGDWDNMDVYGTLYREE